MGAVATPLPLVVAVVVVNPPLNVPLAPLAGAVNVTVTPLSRLLLASFTVAEKAVPKVVFTVVLCEAPPVAVMLAGGAGTGAGVPVESSKGPMSGAAPQYGQAELASLKLLRTTPLSITGLPVARCKFVALTKGKVLLLMLCGSSLDP